MSKKTVAGHGCVQIKKDLVYKKMGNNELAFYKKLEKEFNSEVKDLFPKLLDEKADNIVAISKVGGNSKSTKYCDVKIGFETFSKKEYDLNNKKPPYMLKGLKMYSLDVLKESKKFGFRVEGTTFCKKDVFFKPAQKTLETFFNNDPVVIKDVKDKIKKSLDIFKKQDFTFVGSSFLIAVDDETKKVDVKLIDLEHGVFKTQDQKEFKRLKTSFIDGATNLINMLNNIEKKVKNHSNLKNICENSIVTNLPKDINWNYNSKDFDIKLIDNSKIDIQKENISNAKIWYNTVFSKQDTNYAKFDIVSQQKLKAQQDILLRNICAIATSNPQIGYQKHNFYVNDNTHSIAELLSGGGRFGYIFDDNKIGKKFTNFLISGDDQKSYDSLVTSKVDLLGKKRIIKNINNNIDANLYWRYSSHDQKLKKDQFIEQKYYAGFTGKTVGMDFPIGGLGNTIKLAKKDVSIDYQGHLDNDKFQLGSMLLKYNEKNNKARLMCGFESCAPYTKSPFGSNHGTLATLEKTALKLTLNNFKKVGITNKTYKDISFERSLTGQSKGKFHGIFTSYGSNISKIDEQKLENFKKLYSTIKKIDLIKQKEIVKELLLSKTLEERNEICNKCYNIIDKKKNESLALNKVKKLDKVIGFGL